MQEEEGEFITDSARGLTINTMERKHMHKTSRSKRTIIWKASRICGGPRISEYAEGIH